jgi:hypothetical protein
MKANVNDTNGDPQGAEELPDEVIQGFLKVLESIRLQDMPCSQVFAKLDEYVEQEVRNHRAAQLMPLLREHFDICHECSEEYEALLSVLERSSAVSDSSSPDPGGPDQ